MLGGISLCDMIMFVLATPVQLIVGRRFYRAAWMGVKHGSLGMDALVVMGTSSAYLFSVCVLLVKCAFDPMFPSKCTFETAAMLLTLVSLGKLMEAVAKGQTSSSLTALVKLQPRTALLLPAAAGAVVTTVTGSVNGDDSGAAARGRRTAKRTEVEVEVKEIDAGLVQVGGQACFAPLLVVVRTVIRTICSFDERKGLFPRNVCGVTCRRTLRATTVCAVVPLCSFEIVWSRSSVH